MKGWASTGLKKGSNKRCPFSAVFFNLRDNPAQIGPNPRTTDMTA
jgi:hypothetical protein